MALALEEGLSMGTGMRPATVLEFADKLMWAASVEDAQKLIQSKPDGARAFWHALDLVLDRIRGGKMSPGLPPMKASGPLAVAACSVLDYCEKNEERYAENF